MSRWWLFDGIPWSDDPRFARCVTDVDTFLEQIEQRRVPMTAVRELQRQWGQPAAQPKSKRTAA